MSSLKELTHMGWTAQQRSWQFIQIAALGFKEQINFLGTLVLSNLSSLLGKYIITIGSKATVSIFSYPASFM